MLFAICIQHMQRTNTNKTIALKRAAGRQWVLKPQDLAVAFKLVCLKDRWLPYSELGKSMCLSQFDAYVGATYPRIEPARRDFPNS